MMNQQDIFRKIGSILTELNDQYQFMSKTPENLNELEMELFLANADFLSDHVRIAQKLNTLTQPPHPAETDTGFLLEEHNTIVLPEATQGYAAQEEVYEPSTLEEVATAQEEEERIDIEPEEERIEDEIIKEETTEKILEHNFFKPDQDDHSFEFVLGNHSADDKFDYEEKSVDEIFDRPLSHEEEEILAQKKRIHEKEEINEPVATDDDEIGPEPFLIPHEEEVKEEAPQTLFSRVEQQDVEPVKAVEYDEPIISPAVEERPAFVPQAVPVKPVEAPIAEKAAPTLNDLLAKTHSQTETVKSPVADLKQAINLNEKLLFIKDLFSGYNMAYSEAIDIVNKMTSFEAADSFLQNNYAAKNNWAAKQNTVDQFYELLNRRFSK
ncbi:hypothetical protein [Pedobacter jamesrossensis]|uniref:Uncharacterized protein n=1 Tax=Pedobacter jamesrossensis TaxID=1908238 RepID=A0ABV8NPK7_9SPHI